MSMPMARRERVERKRPLRSMGDTSLHAGTLVRSAGLRGGGGGGGGASARGRVES